MGGGERKGNWGPKLHPLHLSAAPGANFKHWNFNYFQF